MTKDKIEDVTRKQVGEFLPKAIQKSLESYHRFSDQKIPEDAKGFSAHHTACKVAIAHIELLLKLAKWAELPDKNLKQNENFVKALSDAEEELRHHQKGYPDN